jgi:hypothetical protein
LECANSGVFSQNVPAKLLILFLSAIVLTYCTGRIVIDLNQAKFKEGFYGYDAVNYRMTAVTSRLERGDKGLREGLRLAWNEPRHFLDLAWMHIFFPDKLLDFRGHLYFQLPVLALFLSFIGAFVLLRSGSVLYSTGAQCFFLAIPYWYEIQFGLGEYWLDHASAMFITIAVIALIMSERLLKIGWLAVSGIATCFAALQRSNMAMIAAVSFGPVILWYICLWLQRRNSAGQLILRLTIFSVPTFVLALPWLLKHFAWNYRYATEAGYATLGVYSESAISTASDMYLLMGVSWIIAPFIFLWQITRSDTRRDLFAGGFIELCTIPCLILLFLVIGLRQVHNTHVIIAPCLLLLLPMLTPLKKAAADFNAAPTIGILLILTSLLQVKSHYDEQSRRAQQPPRSYYTSRDYYMQICNALNKAPEGATFAAFNLSTDMIIQNYLFFDFYRYMKNVRLYSEHEAHNKMLYPQKNEEEMQAEAIAGLNQVDYAVAFLDANYAKQIHSGPLSKALSSHVSQFLFESELWQLMSTAGNPPIVGIYKRVSKPLTLLEKFNGISLVALGATAAPVFSSKVSGLPLILLACSSLNPFENRNGHMQLVLSPSEDSLVLIIGCDQECELNAEFFMNSGHDRAQLVFTSNGFKRSLPFTAGIAASVPLTLKKGMNRLSLGVNPTNGAASVPVLIDDFVITKQ